MELFEVEIVEVELKYCERCGSLWLRPRGQSGVYCESCIPQMAEFPPVRKRGEKLPLAPSDKPEIQGWSEGEVFLCGEGGNA